MQKAKYKKIYCQKYLEELKDRYIVFQCEICGEDFYPNIPSAKRCKRCSKIFRMIHGGFASKRKLSNGFIPPSPLQEDLVKITKRYVQADRCEYCDQQFSEENNKSLDHITPVHAGGVHTNENISICCINCNRSKARLGLKEWIELCKNVSNNLEQLYLVQD